MTTHELDLDALKALHSKVIGFVFQPREGGWTGEQRTLAELGEDGKWKYWDMNIALSREACEFIVAAHEAFPALVARIEAAERERDALWVSMQVVWQVANAAIRAGEMGGNPHDLFLEQYKAIQQVWKAAVNVIGLDPNDTLKAVFPEFVEKQPSAE